MKSVKTWCIAASVALAAASMAVIGLAPDAGAVTTPAPAITGDPNASNGSITFYNSAGQQIVGGNDLTKIFTYAAASTPGRSGTIKGVAYFAFPDHTKTDSQLWYQSQATPATIYPNTGAPAPVNTLTDPVATAGSTDANLKALLSTTNLDTTSGYAGIVQVRLRDSGPGQLPQNAPFWATDIYFDQSAGTWQQVFPSPAATTSISGPAATPASPAAPNTSVGLSATVTAADSTHPAGTVHLFDGTTDEGAATYDPATGAVSDTVTPIVGTHSYTFAFTPTDPTAYLPSTSPALSYVVANKAVAPTGVKATAGDASAVVSWTAPTDDGGTPVTGYNVQYSSDNGTTWKSASSSFHTSTKTTQTVTGLTNGTKYLFQVAAITAAGTGAYSSPSAAVTPKADASALSIGKAVTVAYGASTKVAAKLTDSRTKADLSGATITLYSRLSTAKSYTKVATAKTSSSGAASLTEKPKATTYYEWKYAGSTTHAAVTSATEKVSVSQVVAIAAKPTKATHGKAFAVYGTVAPGTTGIKVTLQVKSGSSYKTVATASTKKQKLPNGKTAIGFSFSVKESKAAGYTFRVEAAATSAVAAGTSKTVAVKVV